MDRPTAYRVVPGHVMLFSELRSLLKPEQRRALDEFVAKQRTQDRKAQRSVKRRKEK